MEEDRLPLRRGRGHRRRAVRGAPAPGQCPQGPFTGIAMARHREGAFRVPGRDPAQGLAARYPRPGQSAAARLAEATRDVPHVRWRRCEAGPSARTSLGSRALCGAAEDTTQTFGIIGPLGRIAPTDQSARRAGAANIPSRRHSRGKCSPSRLRSSIWPPSSWPPTTGRSESQLHAAPKDQDYQDRDGKNLQMRGVRKGDVYCPPSPYHHRNRRCRH